MTHDENHRLARQRCGNDRSFSRYLDARHQAYHGRSIYANASSGPMVVNTAPNQNQEVGMTQGEFQQIVNRVMEPIAQSLRQTQVKLTACEKKLGITPTASNTSTTAANSSADEPVFMPTPIYARNEKGEHVRRYPTADEQRRRAEIHAQRKAAAANRPKLDDGVQFMPVRPYHQKPAA